MVASVTAITIPHLARTLTAVGADVRAVLGEDARLDVRFQDRIPIATLVGTWERAIAVTGRRDLPAIAAGYDEPDERSLVSFVVAHQRRFGDGVAKFQRYIGTISDAYRWNVAADDDVHLVLGPTGPIHQLGWQLHVEFELLDLVRSVARMTAGRARPAALQFLHAGPPDPVVAAYSELAGIAPAFGCERCGVAFPAAVKDLEIAGAKPALAVAIESQLEALLAVDLDATPIAARARAVIGDVLASRRAGRPALDVGHLARALAMSRRSLERALADAGTSATALIDDERKQRALAWLPVLSVDEVAARLGYSDARAFSRAFKRWTGVVPSRARGVTGDRR